MSWKRLSTEAPDIAKYGRERLEGRVAYLATVRADGSPRVHPISPILSDDNLFVFMQSTSPKGKDIDRNGMVALHCSVEDTGGGRGEFYIRGTASRTTDAEIRQAAVAAASYDPKDSYVLFVFDITFAFMKLYDADSGIDGITSRWKA